MTDIGTFPRLRLLVVGARPGSLGWAVAEAGRKSDMDVVTAGLTGEDHKINLVIRSRAKWLIDQWAPDHIVCTAGINRPAEVETFNEEMMVWLTPSFEHNVVGPMNLLREWVNWLRRNVDPPALESMNTMNLRHFVAVSSNSAHIARGKSMAYCASKAALSMALRCAARDLGGRPCLVYGYEPGLLSGTPMSNDTAKVFGAGATRMKGAPHGLHVADLANEIIGGLRQRGIARNGSLIRLDAGEQ
jgi:NAD(P)-dependent dehydrogenase (short-subunit alcohol dehydrogenase family)